MDASFRAANVAEEAEISRPMSLRASLLSDPEVAGDEQGIDPIEKRLRATGDELSKWKRSEFTRVLGTGVDVTWGTRCMTKSRLKLLFSALTTICSAALNMWFLTNNILEQRRDFTEEYNLTEYVLFIMEVSMVYLNMLFTLTYLIRMCTKSLEKRAHFLRESIFSFKMVGSFSMLWGIHLLRISNLTKHLKIWVTLNKTYCKYQCDSPMRCFRCCCGSCLWMTCSPVIFFHLIFPFLGPVALLLKLRQVSFASSIYFTEWTLIQWFSFFGFLNNVIKLTGTEKMVIEAYQSALFKQERYSAEKCNYSKLTSSMISCAVLEKTKSIFKTWIILNSWSIQPEEQLALLRYGFTPDNRDEYVPVEKAYV